MGKSCSIALSYAVSTFADTLGSQMEFSWSEIKNVLSESTLAILVVSKTLFYEQGKLGPILKVLPVCVNGVNLAISSSSFGIFPFIILLYIF